MNENKRNIVKRIAKSLNTVIYRRNPKTKNYPSSCQLITVKEYKKQ